MTSTRARWASALGCRFTRDAPLYGGCVRKGIAAPLAVALAMAVVGCRGGTPGSLTINGLNGSTTLSWSAKPTGRDAELARVARKVCVDDRFAGLSTAGMTLVVHDQRGPDAAVLVGATASSEAGCFVYRQRDGTIGALWGGGGDSGPPGPRLTVRSIAKDEPPFGITGETGAAAR